MNTKDESAEENTQEKPEAQEDQVKEPNQKAADTNEEAPAEKVKEEAPPVEAKEETPAEEVKEEVPAVEAKEETPAEKVKEEAPPVEAKEETPAEEVKEEVPAVETKEEAPAVEAKEEVPAVEAKEEKEEAPAEEEKDPFSISLKNGSIQIQTHEVNLPDFSSGDTITIHYKIKEGSKERVQHFKGVVLQRKGTGTTEMVTVRKMSGGIGVERIIPLHSPFIEKLEVNKRGKVRRARIFYLRGLKGKSARIEEKRK